MTVKYNENSKRKEEKGLMLFGDDEYDCYSEGGNWLAPRRQRFLSLKDRRVAYH